MLINIQTYNRNRSPDSSMVLSVTGKNPQFFFVHIPGQDCPTPGSHTASEEIVFKIIERAVLLGYFIRRLASRHSISAKNGEIVFVQINSIIGKRFSIF